MSTVDRAYSEKRDFIRMHLEAPVTLRHDGNQYPAICRDLSSTGMLLEAPTQLQLGARVEVHIPSEHDALQPLDVDAEVVRVVVMEDGRQSLGLAISAMR
jgi:hypothetical protein